MSKKNKFNRLQKITELDSKPVKLGVIKEIVKAPEIGAIHSFEKVLNNYIEDLRSIQNTYRIGMQSIITWLQSEHEKNDGILKKYEQDTSDLGKTLYRSNDTHQSAELLLAIRDKRKLGGPKIPQTLQKSLFTQIFSEFDSYIGAFLKIIYTKKPDLLKTFSRQINFSDLLKYDNLEMAKTDFLEKEIENFRRESYSEQFSELERKFNIKTLKNFAEWGEFIELSQRRNLLVHNGGKVNDQYLLVCEREGHVNDSKAKLGDFILPDKDYFQRAIIVMSKIGFMLTHTLWRKIFPEELELSQAAVNNTIFEILNEKRWNTAHSISKFSLNSQMILNISDMDLRIRTINAAISAKFSNLNNEALGHINSLDWNASIRDFRLARAVILENYKEAGDLMKVLGKQGELIGELQYHEWPLFHKFRESSYFLAAYSDIYGYSYEKEAVKISVENSKKNDADFEAANLTI